MIKDEHLGDSLKSMVNDRWLKSTIISNNKLSDYASAMFLKVDQKIFLTNCYFSAPLSFFKSFIIYLFQGRFIDSEEVGCTKDVDVFGIERDVFHVVRG